MSNQDCADSMASFSAAGLFVDVVPPSACFPKTTRPKTKKLNTIPLHFLIVAPPCLFFAILGRTTYPGCPLRGSEGSQGSPTRYACDSLETRFPPHRSSVLTH